MKKVILISLFITLYSSIVSAQHISNSWNEEWLQHRVKQIDEFMNRFNFERDIMNKPIINRDDVEMRKKYIFSLFNADLIYTTNNKDSIFHEIEKFADIVVNLQNPVFLHFSDMAWTAEAICQANFKGKPIELSVFLKTEKISNNEYKWVIIDVKGGILNLTPKLQDPRYMISPVDNELEFMNLPDISDIYRKDVIHYSYKSFQFDRLSAFYALIYNDLLKVNVVERLIYHFYQVPGYTFTVENFERAGKNTGWLISHIHKMK
jgi:hypothetical protein